MSELHYNRSSFYIFYMLKDNINVVIKHYIFLQLTLQIKSCTFNFKYLYRALLVWLLDQLVVISNFYVSTVTLKLVHAFDFH